MTPSDLTNALNHVNDRLRSAWTAAAALGTLAVLSVIAQQVFAAFAFRMAEALVITSLAGVAVALGIARICSWQRIDVYEAILLTRYRHVRNDAVTRYAAKLVSLPYRRRIATGLDRFVEATHAGLPTAVPVNRPAVRELTPRLELIAATLRAPDQVVTPEGMVMLRQLVTDGATSPLFHATGEPRDLERALDRIDSYLVEYAPERALALAA